MEVVFYPPHRLAMGRGTTRRVVEGRMRPDKPAATVKRAKALRRTLTKPEAMLWRYLRASPQGLRFRKQHPAGRFILDFFCARANLAIEIDGFAHDMGDRPARDAQRDQWLALQRIEPCAFQRSMCCAMRRRSPILLCWSHKCGG